MAELTRILQDYAVKLEQKAAPSLERLLRDAVTRERRQEHLGSVPR